MTKFLQLVLSVLCSRRRLQPLVQNFFESLTLVHNCHNRALPFTSLTTDASISVGLSTRAAVAPTNRELGTKGLDFKFIALAKHGQNGLLYHRSGPIFCRQNTM
ncbi:hypothetical protein C8F04DRAFT_1089330 [Mycena alexandri]|uniref:Uncharacterized protein n=1 Tax=Mycena alexandri TaxID=1745969 RepID=A0AAD6T658_9AGAR|nr:hypothetical protein C8F04DRAFT_1089330 [Mycena alexandri]